MDKIVYSVVVVWLVIYIVPFAIYSGFSVLAGLKPPSESSPVRFLLGIALSKLGVALAFVVILFLAGPVFYTAWGYYALLWWVMFVAEEVGQVIGSKSSWNEAVAGILSESIYLPLSAFITSLILGG